MSGSLETNAETENDMHAKLIEKIESLYADGNALGDIAAELDLEYDDDVVWLPGYRADDGNAEVWYDVTDPAEAARQYVDDGDWGSGEESSAVDVRVSSVGLQRDEDGDGLVEIEGDSDVYCEVRHPDEPRCDGSVDGEHRWRAPHELVGGCDSNPGVHGLGGCSVSVHQICVLCGMGMTETSASQGEDTVYDHETVRYDADEILVDDLAQYHDGRNPPGLDPDSPLAEALWESWEAAIESLGHDVQATVPGIYTVVVDAEGSDDTLDTLRDALPDCTMGYGGEAYTDDDGDVKIVIEVSRR